MARRTTGLTDEQLELLRSRVEGGKKPRVQLTGPQFPDGRAVGTVVRIADPAIVGPDHLTVKVTVNGHAEELAFAPNELTLPGSTPAASPRRSPGTRRAASTRTASTRTASTRSATPAQPGAHPATATPVTTAPPVTTATPATTAPVVTAPQIEVPARTSPAATPAPATPRRTTPTTGTTPNAKGRRKPTPVPKIAITLSSTGASWSVTATRGAKSVAKAVAVTPGVVSAVAELLAHPGIEQAVSEVNDTVVAEAELRAAQLRAELAELDAVLATHRRPR